MMEGSPRLVEAFAQLLSSLAETPSLTSLELSFPCCLPAGTPAWQRTPPQLALVGSALRLPQLRRLVLHADGAFQPPIALREAGFRHLPALTCLELSGHWYVRGPLRPPPGLRRLAVPYEAGDTDSSHWGPYDKPYPEEGIKEAAGLEELRMNVQWFGGRRPRRPRYVEAEDGVLIEVSDGEEGEEGSSDDDFYYEGDDLSFAEEFKGLDLNEIGSPSYGFATALRGLAIDLSDPAASGRSMALYGSWDFPTGLRGLTVTCLGRWEFQHCPKEALARLPGLEHLVLPRCDARASRTNNLPEELSPNLSMLTTLTLLDLTGCLGSPPSLAPLRSLPRLRTLSLAGCSLQAVPAPELLAGWPALQARLLSRLACSALHAPTFLHALTALRCFPAC